MSKKVVIDAGHGGKDGGATGNGIIEKEYNLKISKYISERLNNLGIENKLTRDSDELLDQSTRPQRAQSFFGKGDDVIVISNHLNAGGGTGAEIIYSLRNNDKFSKILAKNFENAGMDVRKYYQRRLPSNPSKDYYYLLRNTPNNETLLIEYGFLDNKNDAEFIKNNWKKLAESVVKSIAEYSGVKYSINSNNDSNYYIIKKGDSLWSIAKKYNTSVEKLKDINNLNNSLLQIGQKLLLPNSNDIYTVVKGDSLWNIANKYNTSVSKLKELNNLNSDLLQIGQKIKVR